MVRVLSAAEWRSLRSAPNTPCRSSGRAISVERAVDPSCGSALSRARDAHCAESIAIAACSRLCQPRGQPRGSRDDHPLARGWEVGCGAARPPTCDRKWHPACDRKWAQRVHRQRARARARA
eukprot:6771818-Prymnesium_polylepis.1